MRFLGDIRGCSTDVPLTSHAIRALALNANVQDLGIAELVGQTLAAAIEKDMIQEIIARGYAYERD